MHVLKFAVTAMFIALSANVWAYNIKYDAKCYAEIKGEKETLSGECVVTVPEGDWQKKDEFTVILMPKDKDESHENFYFYYLYQHKLLGKTLWQANMNGGQYSTHAQINLGEDFDIHWDYTRRTGLGVCWENYKHLICFTLD